MEQGSAQHDEQGNVRLTGPWSSLIENPRGIQSIFPGVIPPLAGAHLHELTLDRDGPSLTLRFDLAEYPSPPPAKWRTQGFNKVQLALTFGGLREVEVRGFTSSLLVDISLTRDAGLTVAVQSPDITLYAKADFAFLSKVSGYKA